LWCVFVLLCVCVVLCVSVCCVCLCVLFRVCLCVVCVCVCCSVCVVSMCVCCVCPDGLSLAYQRVQKVECLSRRPVLVLGPLSDPVKDMLVQESPGKFCRCVLGGSRAEISYHGPRTNCLRTANYFNN